MQISEITCFNYYFVTLQKFIKILIAKIDLIYEIEKVKKNSQSNHLLKAMNINNNLIYFVNSITVYVHIISSLYLFWIWYFNYNQIGFSKFSILIIC